MFYRQTLTRTCTDTRNREREEPDREKAIDGGDGKTDGERERDEQTKQVKWYLLCIHNTVFCGYIPSTFIPKPLF